MVSGYFVTFFVCDLSLTASNKFFLILFLKDFGTSLTGKEGSTFFCPQNEWKLSFLRTLFFKEVFKKHQQKKRKDLFGQIEEKSIICSEIEKSMKM